MKKDIVLAGVGGQGILTISILIVGAAIKKGLNFRQAEVHGMSQRGGSVEATVRLSDGEIFGDLTAEGRADMIIGMEPLEALRHAGDISGDGTIVTSIAPVKNIPVYPPVEEVMEKLRASGRQVYLVDSSAAALEAGNARTQNIALLGAASSFIGIEEDLLKQSLKEMFALKGEKTVELNMKAFELGKKHLKKMER